MLYLPRPDPQRPVANAAPPTRHADYRPSQCSLTPRQPAVRSLYPHQSLCCLCIATSHRRQFIALIAINYLRSHIDPHRTTDPTRRPPHRPAAPCSIAPCMLTPPTAVPPDRHAVPPIRRCHPTPYRHISPPTRTVLSHYLTTAPMSSTLPPPTALNNTPTPTLTTPSLILYEVFLLGPLHHCKPLRCCLLSVSITRLRAACASSLVTEGRSLHPWPLHHCKPFQRMNSTRPGQALLFLSPSRLPQATSLPCYSLRQVHCSHGLCITTSH
jgi:hypothetical protein